MKKIVLVALMALCSASFGNDDIKINLICYKDCEKFCLNTPYTCAGSEYCREEVQKMREKCKEDCENRCNSN